LKDEENLELSEAEEAAEFLEIEEEDGERFPSISASLIHVQTSTPIELPSELKSIRLGKTNNRFPPDIDLTSLPDSQFVSRVHAAITREGHFFYIEDLGSSNGTYVNHISLVKGKRHPLTDGSRIALGREDKVSFIFQIK
jgi:pSer/pThr/pTyr-binding forkhead associated (FHA) protein